MKPTSQPAALVTGAAHRIGQAIASRLADAGHPVVIHYNSSADAAMQLAETIIKHGGNAVVVGCDLADADATGRLLAEASQAIRTPIQILVNNASLFEDDTVRTVTKKSFDLHMGINLWAPMSLSQQLANSLEADAEGHIINLIDQRVWNLGPGFTGYTMSKAGLWALTQTMAQELAPNIRVNGIGPGPVLQSIHQSDEEFANESASVPLGAGPSTDEIADAVMFLLHTRSMTGQMIALDGGQHLV